MQYVYIYLQMYVFAYLIIYKAVFVASVVFPDHDSVFPAGGVFLVGVVFLAGGIRAHICGRSSRRAHAEAPQSGGRSRV